MTVTETIIAKVRHLSIEDQQKVLELIQRLPTAQSVEPAPAAAGEDAAPRASIWAKLQSIGEASERMPCDLPEDLAANHDFYLHGLPKRS